MDRHIGCHSDCEKYIEWSNEKAVLNEKIAEGKDRDRRPFTKRERDFVRDTINRRTYK